MDVKSTFLHSERIGGIYKITNTETNQSYFGSSIHVYQRWHSHIGALRKGKHGNYRLQMAWKKYGEEAFDFVFLKRMPGATHKQIVEREQKVLDENWDVRGYNISRSTMGGFMAGTHHSDETKAKMSTSHKGQSRSMSEETKQKLRLVNIGKKASAETKAKMSKSGKGKKHNVTPDGLASLRKAAKLRRGKVKQSPESIAKRVSSLVGRVRSKEERQKLSDALKNSWARRRANKDVHSEP